MDVLFNPWALGLAVVAYAITAWCAYLAATSRTDEHPKRNAVIVAVGLVLIFNFATYVISSFASNTPYQNATDMARAGFDFESGKSYDLMIGDRLGGVSGTVASGGFFTAVNLKPGSIVSVSFTSGSGATYILDLPTERVKFLPTDTVETPRVTIWLHSNRWNGRYGSPTVTDGDCTLVFQSGIFVCSRVINREVQVPEWVQDAGLPPIISDNFYHADIVLSPELYDQVLGRKSG